MQSKSCFATCRECGGMGKKKRRIKKNVQNSHSTNVKKDSTTSLYTCKKCLGSGLQSSDSFPTSDTENLPHISIIGAGIGGVALAVACLHRGIPFTIYERDNSFNERSQGYGLTLQQASKAMHGFGISYLKKGVVSTKHVVHNTNGDVIAEWGMRKWVDDHTKTSSKKTNIHIARQSLREALIEQLGGNEMIKWGHQLIDFDQNKDGKTNLHFQINGKIKTTQTDLIVGADGIRSIVRNILINEDKSPLRYLDCMVILGICSLKSLKNTNSSLLDLATVFQTANGNERIYMMPFDADSVMWQLSFPINEEDAKYLNAKGSEALKEEAIKRTKWHTPVPEIVANTLESQISGYPVYDRQSLNQDLLKNFGNVTLIGDAAHPMSPFKGQGANQALLDALSLAREISKKCNSFSHWKEKGIRESVLIDFEAEMIARSSVKVKDSADAADFLHSKMALYEANEPRRNVLKRNDT
ncbi:FAD-dependent monooxygenase [Flavobacterium sp. xlx-214]|uniref:FAD-dependent monooxygenase n=1 Tax=unclassified Flavobacterium TaxID=196869 RepID=UPI0013D251F3|nr:MULTISPECIES: FAD-dependent monooxygenase [unclassified Flavobacterium]MBA5793300.1 FAD-dependent monooxygenase [Flavobacterium sp. xlx-221]QMI84136.1 FAD-dependent monooxygenase [Flavobacterium sp. xlx-214]